jgi:hypothetical protein
MIDPTASWFKMVKLPPATQLWRQTVNNKELVTANKIFDKSSDGIARLVNRIWMCRYPQCCYLICNNSSEFKFYFNRLCESSGIKCKPAMVKNLKQNAVLKHLHQVIGQMLCTAEIDTANSVALNDINVFFD